MRAVARDLVAEHEGVADRDRCKSRRSALVRRAQLRRFASGKRALEQTDAQGRRGGRSGEGLGGGKLTTQVL